MVTLASSRAPGEHSLQPTRLHTHVIDTHGRCKFKESQCEIFVNERCIAIIIEICSGNFGKYSSSNTIVLTISRFFSPFIKENKIKLGQDPYDSCLDALKSCSF